MEFISIGGLVSGLSPDDIRSGISQPRNKKLAEVFHRLRLIESYGTGIRRIYNFYNKCAIQPRIEVTANTFKIVLPNMNSNHEQETIDTTVAVTSQMKAVLDFIEANGQITDSEVQELLEIKNTRAYTLMKKMEKDGLIVIVGWLYSKHLRISAQ